MADEDLDLDDDLDLGGDDAGDDFAGELDDMMGDDELGGGDDLGGGGGDLGGGDDDSDSELDSFFEDLSSIEDMDEGGSDSSGDMAELDEPEEEAAAPAPDKAKKKKPSTGEKTGSKLKYVILVLVLLGLGGGYMFMTRDNDFFQEELLEESPAPIQEAVVIQKPPELAVKIPDPVIEIQPSPPPPKRIKPLKRYLVQVATCSYEVCKEDYINSLRRDGEPVFQRSSGEKYDFIKVISRQVFSYSKADSIVRAINLRNKLAGNASIMSQSNGHRISMGDFPALDRAKEIKLSIEKLFPPKRCRI